MKRFFWIILAIMSITGCSNNETDTFDKLLFFMDRREEVNNYPYFHESKSQYNVDSIIEKFAKIDTNEIKKEQSQKPSFPNEIHQVKLIAYLDEWLDSISTDEQLIQLVNEKKHSPAARITAFAALIRRGYGGLEQMILDNYKDTTTLIVYDYDWGWEEHTGSVFLRYGDIAKEKGLLTVQDSIRNDSLSLYTPDIPVYVYLKSKLRDMQPKNERCYQRIRELYNKEPEAALLIALARYHRSEDKELIVSELRNETHSGLSYENIINALSAIKVWPDNLFKIRLAELRDRIIDGKIEDMVINNQLMEAVLAYDYQWAHKFIDETLSEEGKKPKHKFQKLLVDAFHSAMVTNEDNRYKDLLKKYPSKHYTNN